MLPVFLWGRRQLYRTLGMMTNGIQHPKSTVKKGKGCGYCVRGVFLAYLRTYLRPGGAGLTKMSGNSFIFIEGQLGQVRLYGQVPPKRFLIFITPPVILVKTALASSPKAPTSRQSLPAWKPATHKQDPGH